MALFGELSLEEAIDLSRDRQILDLTFVPGSVFPKHTAENSKSRLSHQ
jgi:hypothetical protein